MTYEEARKTTKKLEFPAEPPAPVEKTTPASRRQAEEKEEYNYYYNRIYPLLKEGLLDFNQIAAKTGYKERRIRETLLYRLTSGEVMQLFGKRDGFCYICSHRMTSLSNKEPVCLTCLHALDSAIQELHLAVLHENQSHKARGRGDADEPEFVTLYAAAENPAHPSETAAAAHQAEEPVADMVPRAQYRVLQHELNRYRELYGPLPPELLTSSPQAASPPPVSGATASPAPGIAPTASSADDVLHILSLDNRDVPPASLDVPELADLVTQEPLRHFGFQRLKSRA